MNEQNNELKNTTYEIFIGLLSILSIANIILIRVIPSQGVSNVVALMDIVLTLIFLSDFMYRIFSAESKKNYFFHQFGWADLLSSLPLPRIKLLRLFRVFRAGRLMRRFGFKGIFKEFLGNRANSVLLSLFLFIILLLEFGSMMILSIEQFAPDSTITSASDAVWYTFVTITTVGYGDTYPTTNSGRAMGMLIMAVGVALFGTLTGYLSNFFIGGGDDSAEQEESELTVATEDKDAGIDATPATTTVVSTDTRTKLTELKRLLAEQQKSQAILARQIEEIEALL